MEYVTPEPVLYGVAVVGLCALAMATGAALAWTAVRAVGGWVR